MTKKLTIAIAAVVLLGTVGYTASLAIAQSSDGSNHPFVQDLAQNLGVSEAEVKEAFDEVHADRFAQKHTLYEEWLDQAVTDGAITQEQKQALLDKWEEHKVHKTEHKEEMEAWYEAEGIDMEALGAYKKGLGYGRFGHWGKFK